MHVPPSLHSFVEACKPLAASQDHHGVSELLKQLVSDHAGFAAEVPSFPAQKPSPHGWTLGGEHVCHRSDELTVMVLDTLPGVIQPPHDHAMHAIIGVFEGNEEQRFYARGESGVVETAGRTLTPGDVMVLGARAIHAISAPPGAAARAVHVYLGDIYDVARSLFDPDSLEEQPYSTDRYDEFCRAANAQ